MSSDAPNVKLYKALRQDAKTVADKVLKAHVKPDLMLAAKRMGLGVVGKTIMFDGEVSFICCPV